jgi:hypothetical protein
LPAFVLLVILMLANFGELKTRKINIFAWHFIFCWLPSSANNGRE